VDTFACDVCGAQKRDVNRWWIVWAGPVFNPREAAERFIAAPFTPELWRVLCDTYSQSPRAVACGEEHAHELFSRWLVGRDFLAPSQRAASSNTSAAADVASPSPSPAPLPEQENEP